MNVLWSENDLPVVKTEPVDLQEVSAATFVVVAVLRGVPSFCICACERDSASADLTGLNDQPCEHPNGTTDRARTFRAPAEARASFAGWCSELTELGGRMLAIRPTAPCTISYGFVVS